TVAGTDSRIVLVLTKTCDDLASSRRELRFRDAWCRKDVTGELEDGFEIAGQAGARHGEHVAGDRGGQRDTTPVKLVRDVECGSRGGSPVDDAGQQVDRSQPVEGIAGRSGL